jgi:hypothetical protein
MGGVPSVWAFLAPARPFREGLGDRRTCSAYMKVK